VEKSSSICKATRRFSSGCRQRLLPSRLQVGQLHAFLVFGDNAVDDYVKEENGHRGVSDQIFLAASRTASLTPPTALRILPSALSAFPSAFSLASPVILPAASLIFPLAC